MGPRPTALGVVAEGVAIAECGDARERVGAGRRAAVSCGRWSVGRARGGDNRGAAGRRRQRACAGLYRKLAYQRSAAIITACLTREVPRCDCCQPPTCWPWTGRRSPSRRRWRRRYLQTQGTGYRPAGHRRLAGVAGPAHGPCRGVCLSAHRRAGQAPARRRLGHDPRSQGLHAAVLRLPRPATRC